MKKLLCLLAILGSLHVQTIAAMEEVAVLSKEELNKKLFEMIKQDKSVEEICRLIECGADMNAVDWVDGTPLVCAARENQTEICKMLIDKGAGSKSIKGVLFSSIALIYTAKNGNQDLCELLIERGAGKKNSFCFSMGLIYAAKKGNIKLCRMFIDNGADVNGCGEKIWYSPLNKIFKSGYCAPMANKLILDFDKISRPPLMWAVERRDLDLCELLINHGADVNIGGGEGSPLIYAARNNYLEICKLLLAHGAEVNAQQHPSYCSYSALMRAVEEGHLDVVKILVENGANLEIKDREGLITALNLAMRPNNSEILNFLLQNGADGTSKNRDGWSCLWYSAARSDKDICCSIIVHSIFIPKVRNKIIESRRFLMTVLCLFRRFKLPKDLQRYILTSDEEFKAQLPPIFILLIKKGNKLPVVYRNLVVTEITGYTITQLKPIVEEAQKKAKTHEMKSLLDKDLLEVNFGEQIFKNIKERLEVLVQRAPIEISPPKDTKCVLM